MIKSKISLAIVFLVTVFILVYVGKTWVQKSTYLNDQVKSKDLYYVTSHLYEHSNGEFRRTVTITNGRAVGASNVSISITSSEDIIGHSHPGLRHDGTDRVISETLLGNTFTTLIDTIPSQESIQIIIFVTKPFNIEHVDLQGISDL